MSDIKERLEEWRGIARYRSPVLMMMIPMCFGCGELLEGTTMMGDVTDARFIAEATHLYENWHENHPCELDE